MGLAKVEKQIVPTTDNNIILMGKLAIALIFLLIGLQEFWKYGILCIEDVVNEIATVDPHFKEVTGSLCLFSLNRPENALHGKKKLYEHGGDGGNHKDHINELISKMKGQSSDVKDELTLTIASVLNRNLDGFCCLLTQL